MSVLPQAKSHATRLDGQCLVDLIAGRGRAREYVYSAAGIELDVSRQRLDDAAWRAMFEDAKANGLPLAIKALMSGEPVNRTEGRAAMHTALRARQGPLEHVVEPQRQRMRQFAEQLQGDKLLGFDGQAITDLVHIGIGGSELGPRLLWEALAPTARPRHRVHFVASLDQHAQQALRETLDPATTLVLVVSKSFSTEETLVNAQRWRAWLRAAGGKRAIEPQLWAATANLDAARDWGVEPSRQLPMWDWVGGRYSLWSGVSLAVVGALGWPVFQALLDGAAEMDEHFAEAPLESNVPVLKALVDVWNANVRVLQGRAVVSYDQRLAALPGYLQQLEMESNGKNVDQHGQPLSHDSAGIVWGGTGTEAQHAFFQALHQGTRELPLDLIGVVVPDHDDADAHRRQWAHLLAQASALAHGNQAEQVCRRCPGGRSSQLLVLARLDGRSLGALLALHEHATFVRGQLWQVNSFDQFGVEIGKTIAKDTLAALQGQSSEVLDGPTQRRILQLSAAWKR
jgi:glucose-6-phosphate isomerase